MNVIWTRETGVNLIDIEEFIARDSAERAIRFIDALIDHAEAILPDDPRSGRRVPETGNPDIQELIRPGNKKSTEL